MHFDTTLTYAVQQLNANTGAAHCPLNTFLFWVLVVVVALSVCSPLTADPPIGSATRSVQDWKMYVYTESERLRNRSINTAVAAAVAAAARRRSKSRGQGPSEEADD